MGIKQLLIKLSREDVTYAPGGVIEGHLLLVVVQKTAIKGEMVIIGNGRDNHL